ncbi:MAG: cysteine--tRNA ligase [Chloroflexota bacterium]|nr:cysteine--tRNA ligase [Chloroflexota bacterium]
MKLYNTLSRKIENFTNSDDVVKMYVCGITPYSPSHIGHAMSAVVFDTLRRHLQYVGYKVRLVQNFTDIDDKMIDAALTKGITTDELADQNINDYFVGLDALNVLKAESYPKATEEIPKIIAMINSLLESDYAYVVQGDVYYRVGKFVGYGKLSRRSLDSMQAGARVEVDPKKQNEMDFALWKSEKPGEPSWDSPWGKGRPGWHIECSAMSISNLGDTIDIHGGGPELIFPHHENEIAQSEAYTGKSPFVRFWVHHGLVQMGNDKMSKSLGNVLSIHDAINKYTTDGLRLFFLATHYRSKLVYSEQNVLAQERAVDRMRNALRATHQKVNYSVDVSAYKQSFVAAMDDDINTPKALAVMFDLVRDINRVSESGETAADAQDLLKELASVLGLRLDASDNSGPEVISPFVDLLVDLRTQLRTKKQFDLADDIRDKLANFGILIEDTQDGTEWRRKTD